MAGRPPKPTALLRLHGTARPGRIRARGREPKVTAGLPDAPDWLLPEARAEWDRVIRGFAATGVLTPLDRGMLATYCTMWARFVEAERADPYVAPSASFISTMSSIATKLGLDPAARVRLGTRLAPDEDENESEGDPDDPWVKLAALRRISAAGQRG
jgi:phage terminase small subunit